MTSRPPDGSAALGVPPTASRAEIDEAYRTEVLRHNPDRAVSAEDRRRRIARCRELAAAHEALTDANATGGREATSQPQDAEAAQSQRSRTRSPQARAHRGSSGARSRRRSQPAATSHVVLASDAPGSGDRGSGSFDGAGTGDATDPVSDGVGQGDPASHRPVSARARGLARRVVGAMLGVLVVLVQVAGRATDVVVDDAWRSAPLLAPTLPWLSEMLDTGAALSGQPMAMTVAAIVGGLLGSVALAPRPGVAGHLWVVLVAVVAALLLLRAELLLWHAAHLLAAALAVGLLLVPWRIVRAVLR